jgi:hypothetical protein
VVIPPAPPVGSPPIIVPLPGMPPIVIPPVVPGMPVPPVTPYPVTINISRSANGGNTTLTCTGTGFAPGEQVLISIGLNNRNRQYDWRYNHRRHSAREAATAQGQVMHTFTASQRSMGPIQGHLHMRGMTSGKSGQKQFNV